MRAILQPPTKTSCNINNYIIYKGYLLESPHIMTDDIIPLQHPDFIWTWKESARGLRQSIWIPYLKSIKKSSRKGCWQIIFNGGECEVDLAKTDLILLYGATSDIPVEFLDDLNANRICPPIHRRNMPRPDVFMPAPSRTKPI